MAVTLSVIAKACGTTPSTVSRALSHPEKVNMATRERIQRVAREMGYVPNHTARSLSMGRTGVLGLIVPDIANPFFPPIIKAVQERAGRLGNSVLLADTDEHVADELARAKTMSSQVDGLILVSPRTLPSRLQDASGLVPMVLVNRAVDGFPCVVIENSNGIREAVQHLVALGHTRLCYLNGPRRSWSNEQRQAAITVACAEQKVSLTEFGPFEAQIQAGSAAADLVAATDITAVIAYDDLIALGVMARFIERGLRIGKDISVIGIDDSPMAGMAYPNLTSIHVPGRKAGSIAVDLLLDQLDETNPDIETTVQLDTRLVVRGSTGPLADAMLGRHPA